MLSTKIKMMMVSKAADLYMIECKIAVVQDIEDLCLTMAKAATKHKGIIKQNQTNMNTS